MKAAIVALFAATLLLGCVGNNTQSLVIEQNNVPETTGGSCIAPGSASSTYRPSGRLDLALLAGAGTSDQGPGYLMFPVVTNNLSSNVGGSSVNVDDTAFNIQLKRVDVEVTDAASGRALAEKFSVPVYKILKASQSTGLIVDVLPWAVVAALGNTEMVMVKLTVIGERDGSDIRSNTMEYAIEICSGCLLQDMGSCAAFTGEASVNTCNVAQDEPAVCCESSTDGSLVCPAVAETPAG